MPHISPLASIAPTAILADGVEVGPFCLIGPHVTLGPGNKLLSHVVITGHTTIGKNNSFHPHCTIGGAPQDLKYKDGPCCLEIGNNNSFRESVTIHIGTEHGGGLTSVGSGNLLMVNAHLGHDVRLGDHCVIANNVMFAGHVVCGNNVAIMGGVGIHHFVSIGDFAYIAAYARIHHDVPPFVKVADDDKIRALNTIGLRRAGFPEPDIQALEEATRRLFIGREKKPFALALAEFDTLNGTNSHVKRMVEFLRRRDTGKNGRYLEGLRKD
jgi:UDP-N-acetylglucosamine acyltransferase